MVADGATHPPPPRSGGSILPHGSRLLLCQVRTPAYLAAGHRIRWSFPYPPHGDAVGNLPLGPNMTNTHRETHTQTMLRATSVAIGRIYVRHANDAA